MPKKTGLFITGTDTGVGKTLVSGAIAQLLANSGLRVGVMKPIATGCRPERGKLISDDARFLARCVNCQLPLSVINPITYLTPAAPIVSAEVEHKHIDYSKIEDAYKLICEENDVVIVEGIGGIRVPLSYGVDVLELADQFKLPVVVVARPNLGTINQTLLTVDCIRLNKLPFAGVVISGYHSDTQDPAEKNVGEVISNCGHVNILSTVPYDSNFSYEQEAFSPAVLESLGGCDWMKIAQGIDFNDDSASLF